MGRYDVAGSSFEGLGEEGEGEKWLKELDEARNIRGGDGRGGRAMREERAGMGEWRSERGMKGAMKE